MQVKVHVLHFAQVFIVTREMGLGTSGALLLLVPAIP